MIRNMPVEAITLRNLLDQRRFAKGTVVPRVELETAGFAPPEHHALYDSQYTLDAKLA